MKLAEKSFLDQFVDQNTKTLRNVTANQLLLVWEHYDRDGNGFIEGGELDDFLREFVSTVADQNLSMMDISNEFLESFKSEFMEAFDDNDDDRIEIAEMAQILPTEENFLLLFRRNNPLESSVEFMTLWKKYDGNCNGFIDAEELKCFLTDLMQQAKPDWNVEEAVVTEYCSTILTLFDKNNDGKLQLSEMARLLPIRENYLVRPLFKNAHRICRYEVERILHHYDQNGNGMMEDMELDGFLKDLLDLIQEDYEENDVAFIKETILTQWDVDHDGMINREELQMILLQQSQICRQ